MNRPQLAAAIKRHFADHGTPVTAGLLDAVLASSDDYAAHMVEQHARPPRGNISARPRTLAGVR